jgi:hypothetical protein
MCMIDLDSGKFITLPPKEFAKGKDSSFRWFREQGVDAAGNTNKISPGLMGYDLVAMPMPNSMWDRPSHKLLLQAASFATPGNPVFLVAKELPTTFIIKTREGAVGLLQITGFQENPKGVRIRYKLLKEAPSSASPATQSVGR